jgi:ligand-binding sensor domain-containing protein/two-component sensor histidine kinase
MRIKAEFIQKQDNRLTATLAYWRLYAAACLCVFATEVRSQQHLHQFWQITIEHGLVNNIINDITQDKTGYTWIGTSGGLQKFDGMNFVTFTTTNSNLPSNHIQSLYRDDSNVVWILTAKGLCKYDATLNDVTPVVSEGIFEKAFFFHDAENRVWINADGKFYNLDLFKSKWNVSMPSWTSAVRNPTFVAADGATNKVWIATTSEVVCYDNSKQAVAEGEVFQSLEALLNGDGIKRITALRTDNYNRLLIAFESNSGKPYFFRCDLTNKKWQQLSNGGAQPIHDVITTVEGTTWALGENIMQIAGQGWEAVEPVQEEFRTRFHSQDIFRTIYENRDGSLWIGTNNGIFIFTPQIQQFAYYVNPFSLVEKKNSKGTRKTEIIAANDSLLIIAENDAQPIVTHSNFQRGRGYENLLAPIKKVTALHRDTYNNVWATGTGNLFLLNIGDHSLETIPLPSGVIVSKIASDDNTGDLWLTTTDNRILKFTVASRRFNQVAKLQMHGESISSTANGIFNAQSPSTLWITFDHEVLKFNHITNTLQFFDLPHDVRINQAQDFNKEKLLLATDEGLFFFTKESGNFTPVYVGKEQFSHAVAGVSVDLQKNIWAATKGNGLFRISSTGKDARRFGTNEGVVYSGFSSAVNFSIGANRMAIVTSDGILAFNPLHTPGPLFNPRVQITSFVVNEKEQINTAFNEKSSDLKWNENNVRIGFSSMSYLYNDQTTFSYMLQGFDRDWTKVMQPEIVKYSNLPPGNYTFHIRCMATSGEVMSDEATLSFSIVAPLWKTLTFKIAVSVSIVIGIALFYYIRHLRRQNIQEIKNKISRDLHDHIGSSLSSISLMLNVAENKMQSNPQQSSALLKKIENTAQLTQENLHDIVWSIQNEKNSMADIVDRMEEFYVSLFEGHSARIEFEVDPSVRDLNLDLQKRYNLYLLFKEIVNNGAKYSKATRVTTALRKNANTVTLSYSDNGIGFSTDPIPEGNGLTNMKQRAALLGGTIVIQSKPGFGTQIELTFSK